MINALVSVYPNLASVIAMNYACRLSHIIKMGIQPIFVKEPESGGSVPATGWVRNIWEDSLSNVEREAVDRLIEAERAHCNLLSRPQFVTDNRDDGILSSLMRGGYDLFVEGCVSSFEQHELFERIDSKLYRNLPCPVLIARNLMELHKVLILFDDEVKAGKLLPSLISLFDGAHLRFDLLYCRLQETGPSVEPIEAPRDLFDEVEESLQRHGWIPENRFAFQSTPQGLVGHIEEYGLIATSLPHQPGRNNRLLQLLGCVPSPILLCWQ